MRKSSNSSLLFYQGKKLVTVEQASHQRTVFRSIDVPLAEKLSGDGAVTRLMATEVKGSVLRLVGKYYQQEHVFSAYGHNASKISSNALLGFNAEHFQVEAGIYLLGNGYRAYSPHLRRFISPDSWSPFLAGGLNTYAYVECDPVNFTDPTGHIRLFAKTKTFQGNARPVNGGHIYLAKHPEHKNQKAITAVYHGTKGALTGTRGPILPPTFVQSIKKKAGLNSSEFDIHIIACYSGDPVNGQSSFIESVAELTGRRAYGYSGTVNTSEKNFPSSNGDTYYDTIIRTKLSPFARSNSDFNYRPVFADPQHSIRDPESKHAAQGKP
ncbi:hypothetical protein B8W72_18095 [Pseudomonas putida]|uniref:RHS repeat-associated core domain-containing protein n=1 Tax=Pseudomonas putida TaxID=303 RepID=A0A1Y3L1M0_PSEPU|nr:RHS repeat-associated core domain-containing protein [Pseudomonas putida]OUM30020.1 hypothetical protein B8W72_18095 [Pseudomonas putida]